MEGSTIMGAKLIVTRRHVNLDEIVHLMPGTLAGEYLISERRWCDGPLVVSIVGPQDGRAFEALAGHIFAGWAA